jgi:hypothetical protein
VRLRSCYALNIRRLPLIHMNNSFLIGVLVLVVIAIVGWVAYSQGYFMGKEEDADGINIELGGSDSGQPSY